MKAIKNNQQEEAIIGVIQDAIVWARISVKMVGIINAFNPSSEECEFGADTTFIGYENAFRIMRILDDEFLCNELSQVFRSFSDDQSPANKLAETIYIEWLLCIKNYCLTSKNIA